MATHQSCTRHAINQSNKGHKATGASGRKNYKQPAIHKEQCQQPERTTSDQQLYIRNTASDQQFYIENSASNQKGLQATSNFKEQCQQPERTTSDQQLYKK